MNKLIDDVKLNELLEKSSAERITKDYICSRIVTGEYIKMGETVTICRIILDNGYSVLGESACVNPENYNQDIGQRIAYDNAFNKLWPLFGFLLAEKNLITSKQC